MNMLHFGLGTNPGQLQFVFAILAFIMGQMDTDGREIMRVNGKTLTFWQSPWQPDGQSSWPNPTFQSLFEQFDDLCRPHIHDSPVR
jgi:hypothetical protein